MPLDKPDLTDEQIRDSLRTSYGVQAAHIEFMPLGYDFNAGVYRVRAAGGQGYFLKARRDAVYAPGIHIARFLRESGIRQVVAPLPTMTGDLHGQAGDYALLLYPFIKGQSGMEAGLNDAQWVEYGQILRSVHTIHIPDSLVRLLRAENYVPSERWLAMLKQLHTEVQQRAYDDPMHQQLAAFWNDHHGEIGQVIEWTERLSRRMRTRVLDFVLCHADIHTNNLLVGENSELYVVDWDQPMLAPKERDLMFILDGGIGFGPDARQEALFFEGYGAAAADPLALAYYRYEWLAQDLGSFAEMVFLRDDVSEETRQDSARLFIAQFAPGNLAEIVHKLDAVIETDVSSK